jgi:hypothetical protein
MGEAKVDTLLGGDSLFVECVYDLNKSLTGD